MMENLFQAGDVGGGGCTAPFHYVLWCTLQLIGQIHTPYFSSTPICTLWFSALLKSPTYYPLFRLQLSVFLPILIPLFASSRGWFEFEDFKLIKSFLSEALFLITVPVDNNVRTKWKFTENAQTHICIQILCRI
jgi:hypothetical protein